MTDVTRVLDQLERVTERLATVAKDLAVVADRQAGAGAVMQEIREELAAESELRLKLEKRLDKWINRGWGAWGVVVAAFSLITTLNWTRPPDMPILSSPPAREVPQDQRTSTPK